MSRRVNKKKWRDRVDSNMYRPATEHDVNTLGLLHDAFEEDVDVVERTKAHLKSPFTYSFVILDSKGLPLAILGMFLLYPGVGQVFALVDSRVEKNKLRYARACKFLLDQMFDALKLSRMQVMMRADKNWSLHWAWYLGFTLEACMKNYGTENVTYYQFSKVRD